jgi:ubiquinone/menaquinone biosynthesis C-methylase UbiE
MLRVARKRGNKLVQADLCGSWPFASGSFAQVVSLNVLYALPDPKAMLVEAFRVLEQGGELKIASPTSEQLMPLIREHFRLATRTELLVSMLNIPRFIAWGVNLTIRGLFDNSEFHFYSEDELVEMCQSVGFEIESVIPCYAGIDAMIIARKR